MPRYNATGIRMYLGATSLDETTCEEVKRKKAEAAKNSERFEKKLQESEELNEESVAFPGDAAGFRVNFLKNVPFLQVVAGGDVFERKAGLSVMDRLKQRAGMVEMHEHGAQHTTRAYTKHLETENVKVEELQSKGRRAIGYATRAHPQVDPSPFSDQVLRSAEPHDLGMVPKALSLHVLLSEKTFIPSFDDGKPQQLMIDVFFNGVLASSVLMHLRDISSGAKTMHQIFAGHRGGYLIERPWVIVPPDQKADGSFRGKQKAISVKKRWEQLCAALLDRADERGFDTFGDRPPSADYLESLATMEMPSRVGDMQRAGGKCFGVIDVVVTAGRGQKIVADYLSQPLRLPDSRFSIKNPRRQNPIPIASLDATGEKDHIEGESSELDRDAEGDTDSDFEQVLPTALQLPPLPTSFPTFFPQQPTLFTPAFKSIDYSKPMDVQLFSGLDQTLTSDGTMSINNEIHSLKPSAAISSMSLNAFSIPKLQPRQAQRLPFGDDPFTSPAPIAPMLGMPFADTSGVDAFPSPKGGPPAHFSSNGSALGSGINYRNAMLPPQRNFPLLGAVPPGGPLPPIGLFSVLPCSKPSDPGHIDPDQPRSSVLLSRFILIGKQGTPIIDHQWSIPQRVAIRTESKGRYSSSKRKRGESSSKETEASSDEEYVDGRPPPRLRRRSTRQLRMTTPPPTSPTLVDARKTTSNTQTRRAPDHDGNGANALLASHVPGPALVYGRYRHSQSKVAVEDGVHSVPGRSTADSAPLEAMRSNTDHLTLGIQRPKAPPFVLDDPEDLLRRRTRSGRNVPPTSTSVDVSSLMFTPSSTDPVLGETAMANSSLAANFLLSKSSSSSLSSAPSAPSSAERQASSVAPLKPLPPNPQFQSAPMLPPSTASPSRSQPFPQSIRRNPHTPSIPPRPQSKAPVTPTSVPTSSWSNPKPSVPRSTLASTYESKEKRRRLMYNPNTSDNPPQNQDCVICFAQSEKGAGPILRQVKSEKQGVFTEEEVVVGMRFFVAE